MQNDGAGEAVQQQPINDISKSEIVVPPPPPDLPSGKDTPSISTQATKTDIQNIQDRLNTAEKWMIWLTAAIAFSGFCSVGVGYMQWREIHYGSADTHDLAVNAKTQADRMTSMSDAADKIRQAAENMVIQDQRIADNAKIAMDDSNAQSRAAIHSTIAQFRQEQRAWVGVQGVSPSEGFTETEPLELTVIFVNSGKTAAREVQSSGMYITSPVPIAGPRA